MLKIWRSISASLALSSLLILALGGYCLTQSASALAQTTPSGSHGKTTGIPEKKPDGTWEGLKPEQQKILAPLESDWDYMLPTAVRSGFK